MSTTRPTTPSLEALLQLGVRTHYVIAPTSRYARVGVSTLNLPDGRVVLYLRRRFLPASDRFALLQEHSVSEGERLDNITAHYLGDPEQFWQLCDANDAMHPQALTTPIGRRLRITLPEGIPGGDGDGGEA